MSNIGRTADPTPNSASPATQVSQLSSSGSAQPVGLAFSPTLDSSGSVQGVVGANGGVSLIPGYNPSSRPPLPSDNATVGYSTSSVWQYGGTLYTTPNYCSTDAALWSPIPAVAGTATDIMGATNTKFAGGTIAMLKGFGTSAATGQPAIDIAYIVGGKYAAIVTVNILPTGELDNDTLGAYMAQADAGTAVRVVKLYDQSGSGNHAVLGTALGAAAVSTATITGTTSFNITAGTAGVAGELVIGPGIVPGTTISGSNPWTLSVAATNSAGGTFYLGVFDAPYIDWDPILGRYVLYVPWAAKSGLQLPQVMSITAYNNAAIHALGRGISSNVGGNAVLGALGDYSISSNHFLSVIGSSNLNIGPGVEVYGDGVGLVGSSASPMMENQPCVFTMSFGSTTTVTTLNDKSIQLAGGVGTVAVSGGWIFRATTVVDPSSSMMRLVGFAVFNTVPTAAQRTALHYSGMTRLNAMPQIINRLLVIGDSRFNSTLIPIGFGLEDALPPIIGRNWSINIAATQGWTAQNQAGLPSMFSGFTLPGKNYAVLCLGYNDFAVNNSTVAQTLGFLKSICGSLTTNGFKVILIAELNNTDSADHNANTQVPLLRAAILNTGANAMGCYKILDLAGFVPVATASNTNYYYDGVHPTKALLNLIAGTIAPLIA